MRTLFPLTAFKNARNPKFVPAICPSNCFGGFQSGGLKFGEICRNLSENYRFSNFDKFFQISVPLTGTPQNNCWDKFGVSGVFEGCKGGKGFARQGSNPESICFNSLPVLFGQTHDAQAGRLQLSRKQRHCRPIHTRAYLILGDCSTICHENITQLIRKNSNRVTVIKKNSTRTGVPTG